MELNVYFQIGICRLCVAMTSVADQMLSIEGESRVYRYIARKKDGKREIRYKTKAPLRVYCLLIAITTLTVVADEM